MIDNFFNLTQAELKKFDRFIRSPYHNSNKSIIRLTKYLITNQPGDTKALDNKTLFRYVYRNQKFSSVNMGQEVVELVNELQSAGTHSVTFNGGNLSSGVYYYQISLNGVIKDTKRMMLLK